MSNRAEGVADIYINDQQAQGALKELGEKAGQLNDRLNDMRKANDKLGYDKTKKELDAVNKEMKQYRKTTIDVKKVLDNLSGVSYNNLLKTQRQVRREIKGMNRDSKDEIKLYKQKVEQLKKIDGELTKVQRDMRSAGTQTSKFGEIAKKVGPMLAATFSIAAITGFVRGVVQTRQEFEKLEAVLTNTLGSKSGAQGSLKMIQKFAAETPFDVLGLTDSFVRLTNMGFKPTRDEMRKLGDLSSSTGKSFGQLSEAILDANTFEWERLKEFGIRAKSQGDQVTFTFKGIKTTVDKTSESVQKYILGLGDLAGVSGSMAAISATMGGKISNAGDAWDSLLNTMGKLTGGIIGNVITGFSDLVGWTDKLLQQPMAEQLAEEQGEINLLLTSIRSLNEGNEARDGLLSELATKYPEYLKGLNTEKLTNEELLKLQIKINDEFMKRIQMAVYEDELTELAEKGKKLKQDERDSIKQINEMYEKYIKNKEQNLTVDEKAQALQEQNLVNLDDLLNATGDVFTAELLVKQLTTSRLDNINTAQTEQNELSKEYTEILTEQQTLIASAPDLLGGGKPKPKTGKTQTPEEKAALEAEKAALTKLLQEKQKLVEDYYAALNQLEDSNYQNQLSKDEQELMAIDEKYQALYDKADLANQDTTELQTMHAEELTAKLLEIEEESQDKILAEKEKARKKAAQIAKKQANYEETLRNNLFVAEKALGNARIHLAGTVASSIAQIAGMETAIGKAFFLLTKALAIAQVIKDGAEAKTSIMKNLFKIPALIPPGIPNPMFAVASATAAAQIGAMKLATAGSIAQIVATSIPTIAQWDRGKYDVVGASDGRTYRAGYTPQAATGIYPNPTLIGGLGLVGDGAPEMVIDGPTFSNMQINTPHLIDAIMAQRVPQYAAGNYGAASPPPPQGEVGGGQDNPDSAAMLNLIQMFMAKLDQPFRGYIVYSDLADANEEVDEIKNSVSK